ncbi:MAG: hypothetical protein QW275_03350 [Candidatus Anstonellaceae archaeon]
MNSYAVLSCGFEGLSYPLGWLEPSDKLAFVHNKQEFMLHKVKSTTEAEMIIGSSDWISLHASLPVGYVENYKRETFIVCLVYGKKPSPNEMSEQERRTYCSAVMQRLSALHSQGFGCGGISPKGIDYFRKEAKLKDPSQIFALDDSVSLFFEVAVTLRSLAREGYAKSEELEYIASIYLSSSPVCRDGVQSHLKSKGIPSSKPNLALAQTALRFLQCF